MTVDCIKCILKLYHGAVLLLILVCHAQQMYAIFVFRTAQKQEIVRAYRKLAAQWHPDQYDGDDKKHAEKMFIDIAAAKEVLTDPGMY